MFLGVGVKADLRAWPRSMQIVLPEPLQAAGRTYKTIVVNNYADVKGYAPEGCSVITCLLHGRTYPWWKAAKEEGTYVAKKQEVMAAFLKAIGRVIPVIEEQADVTDAATPLTYERYCGTFEGSYMSDISRASARRTPAGCRRRPRVPVLPPSTCAGTWT